MSGEPKRGMFARLFGGKDEIPAPEGADAGAETDAGAPAAEPAGPEAAADETTPETTEAGDGASRKGWLSRLRSGLTRTSTALSDGITGVFARRRLDAAMLQELEDLLIQADLGVDTAAEITEKLRAERFDKDVDPAEVRAFLAREIARRLEAVAKPLALDPAARPHVILVVGVNGSGKTTTIGKLAAGFRRDGKTVVLAAGDTFRAAAIEQLRVWGERVGAEVVARETGADAAGLAFDALTTARRSGADVLLIDTAGRLQNKADLMAELAKIVRVLKKQVPEAPHSVVLVLDATTGQNALSQAATFAEVAGVTGVVMTKLDGTARGGILVAIAGKLALPVHAIGVGEGIDDLGAFEPEEFGRAVVGLDAAV